MNQRQHAAKPKGIVGKQVLNRMNGGIHAEMSEWGLSFLTLPDYQNILEIGCGGGANLKRLLAESPCARVTGVDYAGVSVRTSRQENAQEIKAGRCRVQRANVKDLPFPDGSFDLACAFETIYFWPDIAESFARVCRALQSGGMFFICNETDGEAEEGYQWAREIEGMQIYTEKEIVDALKRAGFAPVRVEKGPEEKHWICFLATKK